MSRLDTIVSHGELAAFVDARLDSGDRARVAVCLESRPDLADTVAAHKRVNAQLRAHFDCVLDEAVPSSLLRAASRAPRLPVLIHRRRVLAIAAGVATVGMLGATAGWWWLDRMEVAESARAFVRDAAAAHRIYAGDPKHPVEFSAERREELMAWLSSHLGAALDAPRLSRLGFNLLGGRLLPASDGPAGQLMYESVAGERVTLYLRADLPNRRELEFQLTTDRGLPVLFWLDGPRGYAIAGELERSRIRRLADVIYDELGS